MKKLIILQLILLLLTSGLARGFDFIKGNGLGNGQTVLLSNSSASEMLSVPSSSLLDKKWKIEMGINRQFELKNFDQAYLAASYRLREFIFSFGFSQFGQRDFYGERMARFAFSYDIDSLTVGGNFSYLNIEFGGHYESLSSTDFGFGASYNYNNIFGAITIDNLGNTRLTETSRKLTPKLNFFGEFLKVKSFSVTGRWSIQETESPQYGLGQKIYVHPIASVFWGVTTAPGTYGGGLELNYKDALITYAASYHPTLGLSQTMSLAYTF